MAIVSADCSRKKQPQLLPFARRMKQKLSDPIDRPPHQPSALSILFYDRSIGKLNWNDTAAVDVQGRRVETRHVVGTGMRNGLHSIMLRLTPAARRLVREMRVYRPPLAQGGEA